VRGCQGWSVGAEGVSPGRKLERKKKGDQNKDLRKLGEERREGWLLWGAMLKLDKYKKMQTRKGTKEKGAGSRQIEKCGKMEKGGTRGVREKYRTFYVLGGCQNSECGP